MRTLPLLISFLFLVTVSTAQSRWTGGIDLQAGFTGQTQTALDGNDYDGIRYTTTRENPLMMAVGGGSWLQYQVHKALGVRLGVGYLHSRNREYRVNASELLATGQKTMNAAYDYELGIHQLNIPLEIVYEPRLGKLRPHFSVGAQANRDWHGTITERSNTASFPNVERTWSRDNRTISRPKAWLYQPVVSIGLQFNEQLTLRVRHTWAPPQRIIWVENHDNISEPYTSGIYFCGLTTSYSTTSTHNRLTSLQLTYRIF